MPGPSQLVLTGFAGTSLTAVTRRRLERLQPGGIVLFRRNVSSPAQLLRLTRDLRGVLGRGALVAVDQEGGRVARLREPFTTWPPMRTLGVLRRLDLARQVGRTLGRELAAAGFNGDFAPVLDVDSNPTNPIIGDRSFAADPALVARLGVAFARGLEEGGVLPCGKHFPGHGHTALDSHLVLPEVGRSRRDLGRTELVPFRAAIRAGIPMLMTAHVLYSSLDAVRPATLSSAILRDLLRKQLHFDGVVVSDDLDMHALDGAGRVEDAALAALDAGCDWLLACQSLRHGERVATALLRAQRYRQVAVHTREALRRIAALRDRMAKLRPPSADLGEVLLQGAGPALVRRIEALAAEAGSRGSKPPGQRARAHRPAQLT
jgi:beta-N-acetylhexosaminidase